MARPLTINVFGDAQVDTTQSKSGGASLYLDGSGDYLEIEQPNGELNITSSWTVEVWIRPQWTGGSQDHTIFYATNGGDEFIFRIQGRAYPNYHSIDFFLEQAIPGGGTEYGSVTWEWQDDPDGDGDFEQEPILNRGGR